MTAARSKASTSFIREEFPRSENRRTHGTAGGRTAKDPGIARHTNGAAAAIVDLDNRVRTQRIAQAMALRERLIWRVQRTRLPISSTIHQKLSGFTHLSGGRSLC